MRASRRKAHGGTRIASEQAQDDDNVTEKPTLTGHRFHRSRTLRVIVRRVIDATTYWITPDRAGVVGLQQFAQGCDILHSRIEPEIVAVGLKDDRKPDEEFREHSVRAAKAVDGKKIRRAPKACEGSTSSARTTFCSNPSQFAWCTISSISCDR